MVVLQSANNNHGNEETFQMSSENTIENSDLLKLDQLLKVPLDDRYTILFEQMAPSDLRSKPFDKWEKIRAGKEYFNKLIKANRSNICKFYRSNEEALKGRKSQAVIAFFEIISSFLTGVAAITFLSLALDTALDHICLQDSNED